jgi:uncharacterized protein YcgI (DUF1989 family)
MPQILAISNCPQVLNPCNAFSLKPLKVEILDRIQSAAGDRHVLRTLHRR